MAVLFVVNFFILNIYNQLILSITIQNPYKVIDSLQDLENMRQLQPKIYMSKTHLTQIQVQFIKLFLITTFSKNYLLNYFVKYSKRRLQLRAEL
jgi:hypothetical protein